MWLLGQRDLLVTPLVEVPKANYPDRVSGFFCPNSGHLPDVDEV